MIRQELLKTSMLLGSSQNARIKMSQVSNLLNKLIGKPVWGATRTHGSAFFIEIGAPHLEIREPSSNPEVPARSPILRRRRIIPVGEYSILILSCFWTIFAEDKKITDDCDKKTIDDAMKYLNGNYIISINEFNAPSTKIIFEFDSGVRLIIEPNPDVDEEDNWNIHVPEGSTLALCPDGSIKNDNIGSFG